MMKFTTFGESHGKMIGVVVEGLPSGLEISHKEIDADLCRRQSGYGRGARMAIESGESLCEIVSGLRWGKTTGAPVTVLIPNRDWQNNKKLLSPLASDADKKPHLTLPRPGHADLAGAIKYNLADITDVLERASARETAARTAAGAIFKKYISLAGVKIFSWVEAIGNIFARPSTYEGKSPSSVFIAAEKSVLRTPDIQSEKKMCALIDDARKSGDTLGGIFRVVATGVPVGLGSYVRWEDRLDGRLAAALMSIQAIKGVEIGAGFDGCVSLTGSRFEDEIFYDKKSRRFFRRTNRAGGIEGGISNGEDIVARCAMKPIPTVQGKPLATVDISNMKPARAPAIRSDITAVPAASVVAEAMTAFVLAYAIKEKFGGDSVKEFLDNFRTHNR